ncbi:undecaprenyl phosphate translocase family protein [Winogradskyella sp.]
MRMLKVLGVFTFGSITGLVTFSHLLNYILKHYKNITLATIVGFIIGSLGVVWPWKETIYKTNDNGSYILDSTGKQIVKNYQRFFPEASTETYIAIAYIALGILIVLGLEWYGQRTRQIKI